MSNNDVMLTTIDNPWNPFTHFDEWLVYDETILQYGTCGKLANESDITSELPDSFNEMCIDEAMKKILMRDELGVYRIVTRDSYDESGKLIPV